MAENPMALAEREVMRRDSRNVASMRVTDVTHSKD
jgi:hypothetical protein